MKKQEIKNHLFKQLKHAEKQIDDLPYYGNYYDFNTPDECRTAMHPDNRHKNHGIFVGLPYDHNLVTSMSLYINASPMRLSEQTYLACQGTLKHTLADFWELIWAEQSTLVMTLTNLIEDYEGRPSKKFEQFWPEPPTEARIGRFDLNLAEEKTLMKWDDQRQESIVRRTIQAKNGHQTRSVRQLHMVNWPDGSIILPDSLYQLIQCADEHADGNPILVHCMGGIGRTGTFIAAHSLYHDMKKIVQGEPIEFDVLKRILEMRKLRFGSIVAEPEQFMLIIESLEEALTHL